MSDWRDFEVLNVGTCTGELVFQGVRVEITFHLNWIGRRQIQLKLDPIPMTAQNHGLAERLHRGEEGDRRVPYFCIRAHTEDGRQFISNHATISSYSIQSNKSGSEIELEVDLAQVEVRSQIASNQLSDDMMSVEYFNKGQLGFQRPSVEHELGKVWLAGNSQPSPDASEYTGTIGICQTDCSRSPAAWLEETDKLAARVCQILSLAHGRLFYWEIRKVFAGEKLISFLLRPQCDPKNMRAAVFHHVHLQPALELAVNRFTDELDDATGIGVALSWFLSSTSTSESGFHHMMTAVEHLVHVFSERAPSSRVVPRGFLRNTLVPAIRETLESLEGSSQDAFMFSRDCTEELIYGFKNANRRSFQGRLREMLQAYAVEISDLQDSFRALVEMRNDVVHRGLFQFETSEDDSLELERLKNVGEELLVRLFLTILGYEGRYNSPLYDLDWRELPKASEPVEAPAAESRAGEDS